MLRRFVSAIDTANTWMGNITLYIIPIMVFVVAYEVVARYVFNKPTIWAMETSQYLFFASIVLAGGYTLLHGKHVNVDIVHSRLKGRAKAIVDIIAGLLLLGFIAILIRPTLKATIDSYLYWERAASNWEPLLFPTYTVMTVGVTLIFLQGLASLIRSFTTAITGVVEESKSLSEEK
ncbi:TRAP transporter small permease subunit [Chloroflexota bacterium]